MFQDVSIADVIGIAAGVVALAILVAFVAAMAYLVAIDTTDCGELLTYVGGKCVAAGAGR